MQKIFFFLIFLIIISNPVYSLDEVVLDIESETNKILEDDVEFDFIDKAPLNDTKEITLYEKIKNINSKEKFDLSKSNYLLSDVLTYHPKSTPVESVHLFGYYRGAINVDIGEDDTSTRYDINSINAGIEGKFKDGKSFYEARFRFNSSSNADFLHYLPSNLYVGTKAIPHHTIMFGNTRTPSGYEGGMSMTYLPFVSRAQISRNFGNVRKVGIRVKGNYKLVDYDIGGYDSDTYFRSFFPGAEFSGWLNLKPLGLTDGRYGKLVLGGGLTAGHNDINYCVTGVNVLYEYKKFFTNFEWAFANGYNGAKTVSSKKAEGFYTTVGYKLTPKLQLLARYDQYTPDKKFSANIKREYSVGINYFIYGQALKVMLNYVFCQNDLSKNSHRVILGTQILL